jgi:uncharacterized membrane protein
MPSLSHVHLLLNHVPTVGTAIAIALLIVSFIRRNDDLKRVALEAFFVIALLTIPAYTTGLAAQLQIQNRPGVSDVLIEAHEDAAIWAFALMQLTGGFAWLALWQRRRSGGQARGAMLAVLLLSALTMAATARTANLGGEIRHPEILAGVQGDLIADANAESGAQLATDPPFITANQIGLLLTDRTWLWPAFETLHFIGMWLIFGVVLIANLRLLGLMKAWSFQAVHRLLPWAALGFVINTATGMMFMTGSPAMYADNTSFLWKLGCLMIAGLSLLYATAFEGPWWVGAGQNPPARVKAVAATAILSWVGVMYFGRMLPFIGNAF